MGISVRKDYWGCGLGSYLMKLAIDQTRANGFEQLELGCTAITPVPSISMRSLGLSAMASSPGPLN